MADPDSSPSVSGNDGANGLRAHKQTAHYSCRRSTEGRVSPQVTRQVYKTRNVSLPAAIPALLWRDKEEALSPLSVPNFAFSGGKHSARRF